MAQNVQMDPQVRKNIRVDFARAEFNGTGSNLNQDVSGDSRTSFSFE